MRRGRHIQKRRLRAIAVVMAAVVAVGLLAAGGGAYAAYRYEQARADRILPGVRVAGVDVGGLTRAEAQRAVKAQTSKTLKAQLAIHVGDTRWIVTPSELGRRADIESAVDAALASSRSMGTFDRFWHRFRDEPVNVSIDVEYATKGDAVEELVARIAKDVWVPPTPASMGINDDATDIVTHRARPGEKLDVARATETVSQAIVDGRSSLRLPTRIVRPKLTAATMGKTIVVWVDRNKLELYDGFEVEETWDVATAKPGWTTPVGVWNIWDKRENPAWYNPALDSWGAGLPAVVPGGPGNPMGTRAIYIDAPGLIRIHGTTDPSSVGRYASHGCIRMHNEQIEDLFERIEVGDNVIIVGHRPAGAAYWDTPAASDI
jgi:lipoprotein-anchoring transpeptidase ErfK/SrfK